MNKQSKASIPVILLAAGNSSRHSNHKLLANFNQHTLIEHTIEAFISAKVTPILVVTGAHRDRVAGHLEKYEVQEVYNNLWSKGMGRSIAKGVEACTRLYPNVQSVIISVCDQAHLDNEIIKKLVEKHIANPEKIIISKYLEGNGPPSIFPKAFFEKLMELQDDFGAKSIVKSERESVLSVAFDLGHHDLDTDQDFSNYFNKL